MNNQGPGNDEKHQERVNDVLNEILASYQMMVDNIRSVLDDILVLKALRAKFFHLSATLTSNQ